MVYGRGGRIRIDEGEKISQRRHLSGTVDTLMGVPWVFDAKSNKPDILTPTLYPPRVDSGIRLKKARIGYPALHMIKVAIGSRQCRHIGMVRTIEIQQRLSIQSNSQGSPCLVVCVKTGLKTRNKAMEGTSPTENGSGFKISRIRGVQIIIGLSGKPLEY
jgi:hypothetical protein